MNNKPLFFPCGYYVIYNHGNADEKIFKSEHHYYHFLKKLDMYMGDTWQLISWCLVPDGYKLIVKIKDNFPDEISLKEKSKIVSLRFSHFTNGFAKSVNKEYNRRGSLFARNFKRQFIIDDKELKLEICSIHNKPCERGYVKSPFDWKFSSCQKTAFHSDELQYEEMIRPFMSEESFVEAHLLKRGDKIAA
jgi:hypothetical protein